MQLLSKQTATQMMEELFSSYQNQTIESHKKQIVEDLYSLMQNGNVHGFDEYKGLPDYELEKIEGMYKKQAVEDLFGMIADKKLHVIYTQDKYKDIISKNIVDTFYESEAANDLFHVPINKNENLITIYSNQTHFKKLGALMHQLEKDEIAKAIHDGIKDTLLLHMRYENYDTILQQILSDMILNSHKIVESDTTTKELYDNCEKIINEVYQAQIMEDLMKDLKLNNPTVDFEQTISTDSHFSNENTSELATGIHHAEPGLTTDL